MLEVALYLICRIHDFKKFSKFDMLSGGTDIVNCRSSAFESGVIKCTSIMCDKGVIHLA